MTYDYDLFVIGAGSGGVRASRIAAQLGARVAIAEDTFYGGTCVNVGCVPKKLFAYASEFEKVNKLAQDFGWQVSGVEFDWPTLRDNKTREIKRLNGVYERILSNAGVEIIQGHAKIVDPHTIEINNAKIRAERILVAVGGKPNTPQFPGAEFTFNSDQAFYLDALPKSVVIQGGGYIAVEFASIFNGLGCEVELLYRGAKFLRGFDEEVRDFVATQLQNAGIRLTFNTDIEKIEKDESGRLIVNCTNDYTVKTDAVFTAIGRKPRTENLGLENTAVKLGDKGEIKVNEEFQTDEPSIYALGDVIGRVELTPVALAEGMSLAKHLFNGEKIELDYRNIATAVFCQPNIATVGSTEADLQEQGLPYKTYRSSFRALKHTLGNSQEKMLMKLLVDENTDKILGAHMVGPDAGELIQGIAIAMQAGATKKIFDSTIGIHPTAAEEFVTMRESAEPYSSSD
ncbi:Glutathione amide reductase [Thalassocella blandensis]|nr:Glutathione amide reductase [Thalassocella blandensis]